MELNTFSLSIKSNFYIFYGSALILDEIYCYNIIC